jgi:hypothetical protein
MSTPIVTARRNLVQRIQALLRKAESGAVALSPWQHCAVQQAIGLLEEGALPKASTSCRKAERPDLYEPARFVADKPIDRGQLVDQLAAASRPP